MKRIGIDFGTANSTIAYLDDNGKPIGHKFGGGNGSEYIPSAIAYSKSEEEIKIGYEAQLVRDNIFRRREYYYFEYYKLDLVEQYDKRIGENGKPVIEVVKDYLHHLILKYKKDLNLKDKLDYISLALPNIIIFPDSIHEKNANKVKRILNEFLEYEAEEILLCCEPNCACLFYVHKYANNFLGNIAIIDYGAGTLDVSNCRINPNSDISKLRFSHHGTGIDELNRFSSYAGVQFDKQVILNITPPIPENKRDIYTREFEKYKIKYIDSINDMLKKYYDNESWTDELWQISPTDDEIYYITPKLLDNAFHEVSFSKLKEYFNKVVPTGLLKQNNEVSKERFRILLVGGFSRLYCVENAIGKLLIPTENIAYKEKLVAEIPANERFLSVAYGAAMETLNENIRYNLTHFSKGNKNDNKQEDNTKKI